MAYGKQKSATHDKIKIQTNLEHDNAIVNLFHTLCDIEFFCILLIE